MATGLATGHAWPLTHGRWSTMVAGGRRGTPLTGWAAFSDHLTPGHRRVTGLTCGPGCPRSVPSAVPLPAAHDPACLNYLLGAIPCGVSRGVAAVARVVAVWSVGVPWPKQAMSGRRAAWRRRK